MHMIEMSKVSSSGFRDHFFDPVLFSSLFLFVDIGRNLMSPSGVTWSCGKIWLSMNAICLCSFCGLG